MDIPHDALANPGSSGPGSPSCTLAPPNALPSESNSPTFPDRRGIPPRNADGRIVCTWLQCADITFRRRSEWTKHMDKHERPHKCKEPGCERVKGFTSSGGLLRHEREIHSKHGGRLVVYCKHEDCERSAGRGFARRLNLAQHMRRMHGVDPEAVDSDASSSTTRKVHKRKCSEDSDDDVTLTPLARGKAKVKQMGRTINPAAVADGVDDDTPADDSIDNHTPISISASATRDRPKAVLETLDEENERLSLQVREKDLVIKSLSSALANLTKSQLEQQRQ